MTFEVSTTQDRLEVEQEKSLEIPFTITNQSGTESIETGVRPNCDGDVKDEWCTIVDGEGKTVFDGKAGTATNRDLAPRDGVTYTLKVTIPKDAPIGSSKVALIVYSAKAPQTVFTESSPVNVVIKTKAPKPPLPWKWIAIGVAAAVVIGVGIWFMTGLFGGEELDLVADFEGDVRSGVSPLVVQFTDKSTGKVGGSEVAPTKWGWDFGDGDTSTEQNPKHTYQSAGTFNVSLVATWPLGGDEEEDEEREDPGMRSLTLESMIQVLEPVKAEYIALPLKGNSPLEVSFADTSAGGITARDWDFGDGSIALSAERTVTHVYTNETDSEKRFTARLTVKGPHGEDDKSTVDTEIVVLPKSKAALTMSLKSNMSNAVKSVSGYAPLSVHFKDDSVGAQDPQWSFGDGQSGMGSTIAHRYDKSGTYTVTLSSGGNQATGTVKLYTKPKLIFDVVRVPVEVKSGAPVNFTYKITGDYTSAEIQYGDGNKLISKARSGTVTHRYSAFKTTTFSAKLVVKGSAGTTEEKVAKVTVIGKGFMGTRLNPDFHKIRKVDPKIDPKNLERKKP